MSRRSYVVIFIALSGVAVASMWYYANRRDSRYSYERVTYEKTPLPDSVPRFVFAPTSPASIESELTELQFRPVKAAEPFIIEGVVILRKDDDENESHFPIVVIECFRKLGSDDSDVVIALVVAELKEIDETHYAYRADIAGIKEPATMFVRVRLGESHVGRGKTMVE